MKDDNVRSANVEKDARDARAAACLRVFSRIAASLTHDVKNCLAVISETSGLLEDVAQMVDDGGVPADRVSTSCLSLGRQVDRANRMLKVFNSFAHSGDKGLCSFSLWEALDMLVQLTGRQAAARRLTVKLDCPSEIFLKTDRLSFNVLLFHLLQTAYLRTEEQGELGILVQQNHGCWIVLCSSPVSSGVVSAGLLDPDGDVLAVSLDMEIEEGSDALTLLFHPEKRGDE